jgi:hypothetical protein
MIAAQSLRRIFRWPTIIAATSLIGLLSALIGDGAWDGLSWAMLVPPVVIGLLATCRGRNKQQEPAR